MHWLCTGTHSEMAVQVAGATARVGLGGIWYQWMWLFSTPFYWLIAPIMRRLRVTTTGDFFRIRYGKSLEMLYAMVGLFYFALSIALLLEARRSDLRGDRRRNPRRCVRDRALDIILHVRHGRWSRGRGIHRLSAGIVDHRALGLAGARRPERRRRPFRPA